MHNVVAMSAHTGVRLAEVAFLLMVIAGIWLAFAVQARYHTLRTIVAGIVLAAAGVLLIIATHWGHFG
jgi:Na+-transporting NADH:ubiquinone oxidoreductase subunit NqrB